MSYVCMCVRMHVVCIRMCMYAMCVCVYVCDTYIRTHVVQVEHHARMPQRARAHTLTHTHTYTHTHPGDARVDGQGEITGA